MDLPEPAPPSTEPIASIAPSESLGSASTEAAAIQLSSAVTGPRLQWSGQKRFKYFFTGVLGPLGCFALSATDFNAHVDPLWQSGKLDVYGALMVEPPALIPFMPLLLYSLLSLAVCCVAPRTVKSPIVRVGIYSGAILSTQYLLFIIFATSFVTFVAAAVVGPLLALVAYVGSKLMPRARRITIWQIMLLTTVIAAMLAAISALQLRSEGFQSLSMSLIGLSFWILVSIPLLNCFTYVRASFGVLWTIDAPILKGRWQIMSLGFGWLLAYAASWKYSLDAMLAEYAKLPTVEPKCYVSAAAAHGHAQFVGVAQFREQVAVCDLHSAYPGQHADVSLEVPRVRVGGGVAWSASCGSAGVQCVWPASRRGLSEQRVAGGCKLLGTKTA